MSAQDLSSPIIERVIAFQNATAAERRVPELDGYLPPVGDPNRYLAVRELARVAVQLHWTRGEAPNVEDYFCRYPELSEPDARQAIALEDYEQRARSGRRMPRDSYRDRFGVDVSNWPAAEALTAKPGETSIAPPKKIAPDFPTEQFIVQRVSPPNIAATLENVGSTRPIAEAGQVFAGFNLIRELGRGAFGRVFLAEQSDLAGREVALKIAVSLSGEVRTLARLQHTNIVPVHSLHHVAPLSALCMPYFGSATLATILSELAIESKPPTGKSIADAIRRWHDEPNTSSEANSSALSFLDSASHVDAVMWIGERLADALAHAHERGIIHRDIKPANILMAEDGQPMLLDFNLADDHNEAGAERAQVGGTLPYMAPEQMRAFGAGPKQLDARVDIYGLGIVLFQLLTKSMPFSIPSGATRSILPKILADRVGPPPMLAQLNPAVSPSLEAIVRKCLEPNPSNRYSSAADLRDDLARQRTHQPLVGVREPSRLERFAKWKRRHPKLVSPSACIAYAAAFLLCVSASIVQLSLDARAKRQDAERTVAIRNYEELLALSDEVKQAVGSPAGSEDVLKLGTAALDRYRATETDWADRPEVQRLPAIEQARLKDEIGELAFLTARAASQLRRDAAWAARLNAIAQHSLGDSAKAAADEQRSEFTGLRRGELAKAFADGSRADFLRACDLSAQGRHIDALPLVTGFAAAHPDDFGGWFLKARCHDELGHYEDARAAYATCAALRPRSPLPLAARGDLSFRQGKDLSQALGDLDRALALAPTMFDARLNRALVRKTLGQFDKSLEDLDELIDDPKTPTRVYFIRAIVREAKGDAAGAKADHAVGMKLEPRDPASFVVRGLARYDTEPELALADFQAAEKLDPFYSLALVNQAAILGDKMNRLNDAIAVVDRLLESYPDHQNGRAGRAVYLARVGRADDAVAEARKMLTNEPLPQTLYQVGCVFALAAKTKPEYGDEAVKYVSLALMQGFGHGFMAGDPDLNAIRGDTRFRKLFDGVKVMQEFEAKK